MELLAGQLINSKIIKDSVVVFDGFTGFTPVQMKVLGALIKLCETVYVTLTLDSDKVNVAGKEQELFSFTAKSYQAIAKLAAECKADFGNEQFVPSNTRFAGKADLKYLERNIFRIKCKGLKSLEISLCIFICLKRRTFRLKQDMLLIRYEA